MYCNYKLSRDIFRFLKMDARNEDILRRVEGVKNYKNKKLIEMLIIHTKNLSMGYYLCENFCYENAIKYYKTSSYSFIS